MINLILVGLGPHSKRVYIPALKNLVNVRIKLIVELLEKKQETSDYLIREHLNSDLLFVDKFEDSLPSIYQTYLTKYVKDKSIQGIIIATEPTAHKPYALWALDNKLHILMDKPITARPNSVSDINSAMGIESDINDLLEKYIDKSKCFIINTQRRFHPGFKYVFDLIDEVKNKTMCPLSSIISSHSDGQWRLPNEIEDISYHGFNMGHGKVSHSGYHLIDIAYKFYMAGLVESKKPDSYEVFSSFILPNGFMRQITIDDYKRIFKKPSIDSNLKNFDTYGEIDAYTNIKLLKDKDNICNININLLHNSFTRRDWFIPNQDLYKGNGRVKHESHSIQQGPFQNIQIHSYQSNDNHTLNSYTDYELGGNNHFDIYVFRNTGILGKNKPLEVIRLSDFENEYKLNNTKLAIEQVKHLVVDEFISVIQGKKDIQELTSNIQDHQLPVSLMSSIYKSHVNYTNNMNPLIKGII